MKKLVALVNQMSKPLACPIAPKPNIPANKIAAGAPNASLAPFKTMSLFKLMGCSLLVF
jgi:hypothetical protein